MPGTDNDKKKARDARYRAAHREQINAYSAAYYAANREKVNARGAAYYADNQERIAERHKVYRAAHRAREKARAATYYAAHREQKKTYGAAYHKQNPDVVRLKNARRKAANLAAPRNDLTVSQWQIIKAHYGHRCVYCDRQMQRLTMDHIVPLSKGGSHTVSNVVPACKSCNSRKLNGPPLKPVQPLLF